MVSHIFCPSRLEIPFKTFSEISARHEACKAMSAYISELKTVDPPDKPEDVRPFSIRMNLMIINEQGKGSMSDQYGDLLRIFEEQEQSHAKISTPAAIADLKSWRNEQPSAGYIEDFKLPDIQSCSLLPSGKLILHDAVRV
jgi:hypothetical protein